MGIETATFISDLVTTNPVATDQVSTADDHLRLIKSVLQGTFPDASAAFHMDSGSWTTTLSGPYSANPTGTLKWKRQGAIAVVWCDADIAGTATTIGDISASGLPSAVTPAAVRKVICAAMIDAGASSGSYLAEASVNTGNTITFKYLTTSPVNAGGNLGASSGNRGIGAGWAIVYPL